MIKKLILIAVCLYFVSTCGFVQDVQFSSRRGGAEDPALSPTGSEDPALSPGGQAAGTTFCHSSAACVSDCNTLFARTRSFTAASRKCEGLYVGDVKGLKSAVRQMEKGNWNSIKPAVLKRLQELDIDLWIRKAQSSKESSRRMLLWLAEKPEVALELDSEGRVLRAGFESLGRVYGSRALLESMKMDIDVEHDQHRTFFEVAAIYDNVDVFKKAHQLVKEECGGDWICVKQVYCASCSDIIFGYLNKLDLGQDADSDGLLHKRECSRCE